MRMRIQTRPQPSPRFLLFIVLPKLLLATLLINKSAYIQVGYFLLLRLKILHYVAVLVLFLLIANVAMYCVRSVYRVLMKELFIVTLILLL